MDENPTYLLVRVQHPYVLIINMVLIVDSIHLFYIKDLIHLQLLILLMVMNVSMENLSNIEETKKKQKLINQSINQSIN